MPAIATVTTRPFARRVATVLPARSIWHSSQPPKMSPCGLVSAGIATARSAGSVVGGTSGASDADGDETGDVGGGRGMGVPCYRQPCSITAIVPAAAQWL